MSVPTKQEPRHAALADQTGGHAGQHRVGPLCKRLPNVQLHSTFRASRRSGTGGRRNIGLRRQSSFALLRNEYGSETTCTFSYVASPSCRHSFGPRLRRCKKATSRWQSQGTSPERPASDLFFELGSGPPWDLSRRYLAQRLPALHNDVKSARHLRTNMPLPFRRSKPPVTNPHRRHSF